MVVGDLHDHDSVVENLRGMKLFTPLEIVRIPPRYVVVRSSTSINISNYRYRNRCSH